MLGLLSSVHLVLHTSVDLAEGNVTFAGASFLFPASEGDLFFLLFLSLSLSFCIPSAQAGQKHCKVKSRQIITFFLFPVKSETCGRKLAFYFTVCSCPLWFFVFRFVNARLPRFFVLFKFYRPFFEVFFFSLINIHLRLCSRKSRNVLLLFLCCVAKDAFLSANPFSIVKTCTTLFMQFTGLKLLCS